LEVYGKEWGAGGRQIRCQKIAIKWRGGKAEQRVARLLYFLTRFRLGASSSVRGAGGRRNVIKGTENPQGKIGRGGPLRPG